MNIKHQPKTLTLMSKIQLMDNCVIAGKEDVLEELPFELRDDVSFLIELAKFVPFFLSRGYVLRDVLYKLLEVGLQNYSKLTDTSKLLKLLLDTRPYILSVNAIATKAKNILDLDENCLCHIIKRLDCCTILNNIFILSALYGNIKIFRLCVQEGADDFPTAKKAAFMLRQKRIISLFKDISRSVKCQTKYVDTAKYKEYYNYMRNHEHREMNVFCQIENQGCLKAYFTLSDRKALVRCHERNLTTVMCNWGYLNMFQIMCALPAQTLRLFGVLYVGGLDPELMNV